MRRTILATAMSVAVIGSAYAAVSPAANTDGATLTSTPEVSAPKAPQATKWIRPTLPPGSGAAKRIVGQLLGFSAAPSSAAPAPASSAPAPSAPAPAPASPAPAASSAAPAPAASAAQPAGPSATSTDFVTTKGTSLNLRGQKYRFSGYDSFVMTGCGNPDEKLGDAGRDSFFAGLRANSVVRAWLFPGTNLADADKVVASAKKYNQRVIWTLTDSVGGCGDSVKDQNWFASGYKGAYLDWIKQAVPHFANNPTVAFWELINEPSGADNNTLRAFFDNAGGLVHSLDHNHLVSSGTQPDWAYGGESGYQMINGSSGVDIMSMHEYDQGPSASPHLPNALQAADANNKPLLVGEYGVLASPNGDPGQTTSNGGKCESFSSRASMVQSKLKDYLSNPEVAGILYWSYKNNQHTDCTLDTFAGDPMTKVIHDVALS